MNLPDHKVLERDRSHPRSRRSFAKVALRDGKLGFSSDFESIIHPMVGSVVVAMDLGRWGEEVADYGKF